MQWATCKRIRLKFRLSSHLPLLSDDQVNITEGEDDPSDAFDEGVRGHFIQYLNPSVNVVHESLKFSPLKLAEEDLICFDSESDYEENSDDEGFCVVEVIDLPFG